MLGCMGIGMLHRCLHDQATMLLSSLAPSTLQAALTLSSIWIFIMALQQVRKGGRVGIGEMQVWWAGCCSATGRHH